MTRRIPIAEFTWMTRGVDYNRRADLERHRRSIEQDVFRNHPSHITLLQDAAEHFDRLIGIHLQHHASKTRAGRKRMGLKQRHFPKSKKP